MAKDISNSDDIIDSRDVIERINDLDEIEDRDEDENDELAALHSLAEQGEDCADWLYGETLIRDSYFVDYARDLAEDIGAIDAEASWPLHCIDWEWAARELQMDYTSVDFDGV